MSEKYKKTCKYLNYVENLLVLASTVPLNLKLSTFQFLHMLYWFVFLLGLRVLQ